MRSISSGKVAIKVNDENGVYFPTFQGLRDSPLSFDYAADALAIMIERAVSSGLISNYRSWGKFCRGRGGHSAICR
jgi:hypothetical protein